MTDYFEIEIIDKQGNKFYEISTCIKDSWDLMKLHNGVSFKTLEVKSA